MSTPFDTTPKKLHAPFTDDQITRMQTMQRAGGELTSCPMHPASNRDMLVARNGFHCTASGCTTVRTEVYEYKYNARLCTAQSPIPATDPPRDGVVHMHVDAYNADPEYDGDILLFHCPNCGITFNMDLR